MEENNKEVKTGIFNYVQVIDYYCLKTYREAEVQLRAFLTS